MILNKHNNNVNFVSKFLEHAQHLHIYDIFHKKTPAVLYCMMPFQN